jgi:hypothetical protein
VTSAVSMANTRVPLDIGRREVGGKSDGGRQSERKPAARCQCTTQPVDIWQTKCLGALVKASHDCALELWLNGLPEHLLRGRVHQPLRVDPWRPSALWHSSANLLGQLPQCCLKHLKSPLEEAGSDSSRIRQLQLARFADSRHVNARLERFVKLPEHRTRLYVGLKPLHCCIDVASNHVGDVGEHCAREGIKSEAFRVEAHGRRAPPTIVFADGKNGDRH